MLRDGLRNRIHKELVMAKRSSSRRTPARARNGGKQQQLSQSIQDVMKANPFEPMERFVQAFMPWLTPFSPQALSPKLDVIERDSSVLVRAEVPGVNKGNLEVEASDTSVTIKGEVEQQDERDEKHYSISETSRGAFVRTVSLPSEVDSTKAKATFRDGVVEVMLPKVDRSRSHQVKL
jgi:HSP20 family protein